MKNLFLTLLAIISMKYSAQEYKQIPQVTVSGEGKISVVPDIAEISLGIQSNGKDAKEVKLQNDLVIEKLIKYIKKFNIPEKDYQTSQLSLYKNYDYDNKKHTYQANQSITLILRDMSKYNLFVQDVMETGINTINGIVFKSSKMVDLEVEARKRAILNAKKKAEDFAGALNQKIGKAILITDQSISHQPQPLYYAKANMDMGEGAASPRETLAAGEIEIICNVNASFVLD